MVGGGRAILGVDQGVFKDCKGILTDIKKIWKGSEIETETFDITFSLADINPQKIKVWESGSLKGIGIVGFETTNRRGVISVTNHVKEYGVNNGDKYEVVKKESQINVFKNEHSFGVRDLETAERIAKALRHAVNLCGGKKEPF